MRKLSLVLASLMAVAFTFATLPAKAGSHAIEACLITKTDINPFFVKMKEGAKAKADELGIKLSTFAGKIDGDHETQVKAVETCIASGASGILIAASDTKAITTVLGQAQRLASKSLQAIELALEGKEYLIGDFSGVEFMTGHCCTKLSNLGCVTEEMPNLKGYVERIEARPAFKKAIETT